jgi:ankyrin repeat protein
VLYYFFGKFRKFRKLCKFREKMEDKLVAALDIETESECLEVLKAFSGDSELLTDSQISNIWQHCKWESVARMLKHNLLIPFDASKDGIYKCAINASFRGNLNLLKTYVEFGLDLPDLSIKKDYVRNINWSSLEAAALRGHLEIVEYIVTGNSKHPDVDGNISAFLLACEHNRQNVAEYFLKNFLVTANSVPSDINDQRRGTALMRAALYGHEKMVQFLLDNGADVFHESFNSMWWRRETALTVASTTTVKRILKRHIWKLKSHPKNDYRDLLSSASNNADWYTIEHLLDLGIPVSPTSDCVVNAARHGNLEMVKTLTTLGNVGRGGRCLTTAAGQGHLDIVKFLCTIIVDENEKARAFLEACDSGQYKVVEYFLESGIPVDTRSDPIPSMYYLRGCTGLMLAARKGHKSTCQLLLDRGADLNVKDCNNNMKEFFRSYSMSTKEINEWSRFWVNIFDSHGDDFILHLLESRYSHIHVPPYGSCLVLACKSKSLKLVQKLLNLGCMPNVLPPNCTRTPLEWACKNGKLDIVQYFFEHKILENADYSCKPHRGVLVPLEIDLGESLISACTENHKEIVKLLIAHGANVNYDESKFYRRPILQTIRHQNNGLEVFKLLYRAGATISAEELADVKPSPQILEIVEERLVGTTEAGSKIYLRPKGDVVIVRHDEEQIINV